jgi:hypothetical protein
MLFTPLDGDADRLAASLTSTEEAAEAAHADLDGMLNAWRRH